MASVSLRYFSKPERKRDRKEERLRERQNEQGGGKKKEEEETAGLKWKTTVFHMQFNK